jgi:hypothetical protein
MRKFEEAMIKKISLELIEKLKYERLKMDTSIKIFTNGNWLTINTNSENLDTPFLQMIVEKWKEQTKKEGLSFEDRDYIERIRYCVSVHFYTQLSYLVQKRMELECEAKYLGGLLFEIYWREQRYEVKLEKFKDKMWVPEELPLNKLFLEDIKLRLCENEIDISLSILLISRFTFIYLSKIYEQTPEYKLKNIYK